MTHRIEELCQATTAQREQTARLLYRAFKGRTPAWPDLASARAEVDASLAPGKISLILVSAEGEVLGWIGGAAMCDGKVWELHPLVVEERVRGQGHGRRLVAELERRVRDLGAVTLWVGSDDEDGSTSLYGKDLYPDLLGALAAIENVRGHPYEFYRRVGFAIAGVVPDANGPGKPDILLAKRVPG